MTPYMHLYILASGSKGNAAVVEGPKGSVLVDCGLSRRELHRRAELVKCDLSRVCAVLVTHEHGDHTSGLSVIANHFDGPIYATEGTATARTHLQRLPFTCVSHDCHLELGGMSIQAFPTSHDVRDPMCFRFEVRRDGQVADAIAWATDTGFLTQPTLTALRGCRILGIEANHDPEMLATGPYLPRLVTDDTETVVAMHISEKNNLPELAEQALQQAVGSQANVRLGSQTEPLVVW